MILNVRKGFNLLITVMIVGDGVGVDRKGGSWRDLPKQR
jgi:hypothetical protein